MIKHVNILLSIIIALYATSSCNETIKEVFARLGIVESRVLSVPTSDNSVFISGDDAIMFNKEDLNNRDSVTIKELLNYEPNENKKKQTTNNGQFNVKTKSDGIITLDGMGYKILRQGAGLTLANQLNEINTVYEIRDSFDLGENTILACPFGSILYFNGGSINNGTLIGNNTQLKGDIHFNNVFFGGFFINFETINWRDFPNCDLSSFIASTKCTIDLNSQTINLSSDLVLTSDTELLNGTINCGKYKITTAPVNSKFRYRITRSLYAGDTEIPLETVDNINPGDFLVLDNGYDQGSFWKLFSSSARVRALSDSVVTANAQIVQVKAVLSKSIIIYDSLESDFPLFPKATNIIEDEVLNNAFLQRIGDNKNIILRDLKVLGNLDFSYLNNCKMENLDIVSSTSNAINIVYSINTVVDNCAAYSDNYALRLGYFSYNCVIQNCSFRSDQYNDAILLFIYNTYNCTVKNCTLTGNISKSGKAGIYFNSCRDNMAYNNDIINSHYGFLVAYDFGGHVCDGLTVTNCTCAFSSDVTRHCIVKNCLIRNQYPKSSVANGYQVLNSYDISFSNIVNNTPQNYGVITNSFEVVFRDCYCNGFVLNTETNDFLQDRFIIKTDNCSFIGTCYLRDGDNVSPETGKRYKIFNECKFIDYSQSTSNSYAVYIGDICYTQNSFFKNCTFTSPNTAIACACGNNSFINCVFDGGGKSKCDFNINVASPSGGEFVGSSAQYFENCTFVNKKASIISPLYAYYGYAIPSYFITGRRYSTLDANCNVNHFIKKENGELELL